jgi:L-aspartate oxidase
MRLKTGTPGWTARADVVVVGSGVAGLTTALQVRAKGLTVLLVTKARVDEGSTKWAQGGIAAALGPGDTPKQHEEDTLIAGAGLCDLAAVKVLVAEGPEAVRRLIARGAVFDHEASGEISLHREGGHHRNRILHAGGDATGAEVSRALLAAVTQDAGIEVVEHALVLDAIKDAHGQVCGVTLHVIGAGSHGGIGRALCRAVVLATGGLGQVYAQTTNPAVATGDGVGVALRAGARIADIEFVQFHPTVMWLDAGQRFMLDVHPLADLAPRDVVAKAIMRKMIDTGRPHVWLDARNIENWQENFPTIYASCAAYGVNPSRDLIPVSPAAHYASGGARVDLNGRTTIPGLYACGETACTGVHGANRLASNSLLEGLVFAARIADDLALNLPTPGEPIENASTEVLLIPSVRDQISASMTDGAGVLRSALSLEHTRIDLDRLGRQASSEPCVEAWEATNLHIVARAIVEVAKIREETRGSHWREDFPETSPAWQKRILLELSRDGSFLHTFEPVANA